MNDSQKETRRDLKRSLMDSLKWLIFPGINLHARERFKLVPTRFTANRQQQSLMLDAGFGNGMLAWQAWRRGYRVVGVSLKDVEVSGARRQFNERQKIPATELCFLNHNLYDTVGLKKRFGEFDEIVCADVIEHIVDDKRICAAFFELLRGGGKLHLTTPNADHPYNANFPLDREEKGGHVRPGYNLATFRQLLEPLGFVVEEFFGFGGDIRQWFNRQTKEVQEKYGPWAGVPLFLCAQPFLPFDKKPPIPSFSYYIRVRKPGGGTESADKPSEWP